MKADVNHWSVIGRIVRDTELVIAGNGVKYAKFTVAVNSIKKKENAYKDYANFFDFVIFDKFAESLQPHLKKGQQVSIEASLEQSRWEKDGEKRSAISFVCKNIQLLGFLNNKENIEEEKTTTETAPLENQIESQVENDKPDFDLF